MCKKALKYGTLFKNDFAEAVMEQVGHVARNKITLSLRRIGIICFIVSLLVVCPFTPVFAKKSAAATEITICNNARLSNDDTIRQIASFFAMCTTQERVTADLLTYLDCETILRTMLVHTDAIIDTRVEVEDSVVSISKSVANEYINLLFNRDLPEPDTNLTSLKRPDQNTIFDTRFGSIFFGEAGWDIGKLSYYDTVSDTIEYGDDGVVKGTFVFKIDSETQSTVELTLVPSTAAFRYYVVSFQVTQTSGSLESGVTTTPYACDETNEQLQAAVDAYDSGHYSNAITVLKEFAEAGNAVAQRYLAEAYQYGHGISGSATQAFYWYSKAAEQGEPNAECFLGSCYRNGTGTAIDLDKMLYWYEKSVDQENMYGLINLGYCYHKGIGVEADLTKARDLYERAAAAGHPYAKKRIAELDALCGQ